MRDMYMQNQQKLLKARVLYQHSAAAMGVLGSINSQICNMHQSPPPQPPPQHLYVIYCQSILLLLHTFDFDESTYIVLVEHHSDTDSRCIFMYFT